MSENSHLSDQVVATTNKLSDVSVLTDLTRLKDLHLGFNQLSDVSALVRLTNLTHLYLHKNQLSTISLDFLAYFPLLEFLHFSGNPTSIPEEITTQWNCLDDLKNYLKNLQEGSVINNRVKVVFIGNGSVGKTQVAKRLVEKNSFVFNSQHDSTHAIALLRRTLECDIPGIEELELMLWDFAGQDIYHATHQLFMQTQAIFVLVWDIENENNKSHHWQGKEYENRDLQYWLAYAHCFGRNSPVIVVQNKIDRDQGKKSPLTAAAEKQYSTLYPNVRAFLKLSAKTGEEFFPLEDKIVELFEEDKQLQQDLTKKLPVSWVKIRTEIENWQRAKIKQMSLADFCILCMQHGAIESLITLFKFFHNSGLFFYKEGCFNNQVILDQEWAIEAVYKVLDRQSDYVKVIRSKKGQLRYREICKIWKEHSDEERALFIYFMLSCELCFEVGEDKWERPLNERSFVIPQLLPKEQPDEDYLAAKGMTEEETIRYRFLPEVFMQRLIIRANRLSDIENMWQSGILIETNSKQCALVEADYENNTIVICYKSGSRELVDAIKEELKEIEGKGRVKAQRASEEEEDHIGLGIKLSRKGLSRFTQVPKKTPQEQFKEQVQGFIKHGDFDEAMDILLEYVQKRQNAALEKDCIHQMGIYSRLKQQQRKGTISAENLKISEAQLSDSLLELLAEIR